MEKISRRNLLILAAGAGAAILLPENKNKAELTPLTEEQFREKFYNLYSRAKHYNIGEFSKITGNEGTGETISIYYKADAGFGTLTLWKDYASSANLGVFNFEESALTVDFQENETNDSQRISSTIEGSSKQFIPAKIINPDTPSVQPQEITDMDRAKIIRRIENALNNALDHDPYDTPKNDPLNKNIQQT